MWKCGVYEGAKIEQALAAQGCQCLLYLLGCLYVFVYVGWISAGPFGVDKLVRVRLVGPGEVPDGDAVGVGCGRCGDATVDNLDDAIASDVEVVRE